MTSILINITSFFQANTKVLQARFAKPLLAIVVLIGLLSGKTTDQFKPIADVSVEKNDLLLQPLEGKWYYGGKPFNGYAKSYFSNGKIAQKTPFYGGKREGIAKQWYQNGQLKKETNYSQNRKDGEEKLWNAEGILIKSSVFSKGTVNGVQREWYSTGEPFKKMNIANGKEEGMQQVWWKNGKLYVNYEAKNGRIFGLKRSSLCYELENETLQK